MKKWKKKFLPDHIQLLEQTFQTEVIPQQVTQNEFYKKEKNNDKHSFKCKKTKTNDKQPEGSHAKNEVPGTSDFGSL